MFRDDQSIVTPRLVLGAWIALMGIILMLDRVGIVDARVAFRLWPIVIVAAGAVTYFRSSSGGHTNGMILMVVGGWLLLNAIGVIRVGLWDLFWPLLLIAAGTALVMQTLQRGQSASAGVQDDRLSVFTVMSSVQRVSKSTSFRGGEIAALMGGGRLDLREAMIPEGEEAVIDVLAVMSGFEIFVPPTWNIVTPIVPIMGNVGDRSVPTGGPVDGRTTASTSTAAPRLVLRGFLLMSGIHIRR